ncbi:MAG: hypothetical protein ACD_45C00399G0002 [uncultured bacterium]|nr:MAG: hypothetical protein ACD_45C00399G0002 [uncultured bacterium]OGT54409.1 MAG: hypothetical protein A3F43_04825 [Gammaproteobacteria bacterium RIFCSPHIGHO2_12_FULL_42_10]
MSNWKKFTIAFTESWLAFFIATFAIALYFSRITTYDLTTILISIGVIGLYLFVLIFCIHRLVTRLPIAVLMLLVPIAPLMILLFLVASLPIIQRLSS